MATRYLCAIGYRGERLLHLVREGAEAALCGVPRGSLSTVDRIDDTTVCRECIEWLPKRLKFSAQHPKIGA